jgi:hypothetical protein
MVYVKPQSINWSNKMINVANIFPLPISPKIEGNFIPQSDNFSEKLAFQPVQTPKPHTAKTPIIRLIFPKGKSAVVRFIRKGANLKMLISTGKFLGEGPAKQLLPFIEAQASKGIFLKNLGSRQV